MISYNTIELEKAENQQKGKVKYVIEGKKYFAEEAAIKYYESLGYSALWTENYYWWTLMALLFWDIIFAKIPGLVTANINGVNVKLSPNHPQYDELFNIMINLGGMPNDFFKPEFYERRKNLINNRIQELLNRDLEPVITRSYQQNYGKPCRPIEDWDRYKLNTLLIPTKKMDNTNFLKLLNRLISNFKDNRSGLPDLIVYNDHELFFSEVKSDNDRVSEKQKEWHSFLSEELNLKVELFLINQSKNKVRQLKSSSIPNSKTVKISFGYSTSKNREAAIEFVKNKKSYFTEGSGKNQIHGAIFETSHINELYKILNLTSRWKTQKIEINEKLVKSTDLRNSLWCFKKKNELGASLDYCVKNEHNSNYNKFGCKNIYFNEIEVDQWTISENKNYGYFDTNSGEWIFYKEEISASIKEQLKRFKYCPLINPKKVRNVIKKLPNKINPKKDEQWALISNEYMLWFWYAHKWINQYGNVDFSGFSTVIGVKKSTNSERSKAIQNYNFKTRKQQQITLSTTVPPNQTEKISDEEYKKKKFKEEYNVDLDEYNEKLKNTNKKVKPKKSGCFIATAVYGDTKAPEVITLKHFRDNYLKNKILGRILIELYYKISPHTVKYIQKHHIITVLLRKILDKIVKLIEKR